MYRSCDPTAISSDMLYFDDTLKKIDFAASKIPAPATCAKLLKLFKNPSIVGFKPMSLFEVIHQPITWLLFVIPVKCFIQPGISAGACGRVVEIGGECFFHIFGKEALADEGDEDMPELGFPFKSMRLCLVSEMYKDLQMRKLMKKRDQEAIGIKIYIDGDAMIGMISERRPVVSENALPFMGKGKMNRVKSEKRHQQLESALGNESLKQIERCFLFHLQLVCFASFESSTVSPAV